MKRPLQTAASSESGFTLIELLVSLVISVTLLSGVVQVLVTSKSNFVTARELAIAQENARYAMKFIVDEIRMSGFTGCNTTNPLIFDSANVIKGSLGSWYLDNPGVDGYDQQQGTVNFPVEFRDEVAANTDALVVRRSASSGLRITGHQVAPRRFNFDSAHSFKPGQAMVITSRDCNQIGVFQISNPANNANDAVIMRYQTGASTTPGNCGASLGGTFECTTTGSTVGETPVNFTWEAGATIRELQSEAFYIRPSINDLTVPALFRERMLILPPPSPAKTLGTVAEELVSGVENLQVAYGVDTVADPENIADQYVDAAAVADWKNVVSIRVSLRMRSQLPVHNSPVAFAEFEGVAGTDGADRFMRQDISTTVTIRNP